MAMKYVSVSVLNKIVSASLEVSDTINPLIDIPTEQDSPLEFYSNYLPTVQRQCAEQGVIVLIYIENPDEYSRIRGDDYDV